MPTNRELLARSGLMLSNNDIHPHGDPVGSIAQKNALLKQKINSIKGGKYVVNISTNKVTTTNGD